MSKCGKHTLPVATGSIQAAAARNRTDGAAGDRVRRQSAAAYRLPLGRIGLGLAAAVMAAGLAGTPGITASNGAPSAEEWLQALYGLPLYDLPFERTAMQARIWVAPTGDDDAEGSLQAPLRTIQAAIDRAAPGTAILVRAGSYSENVHFWSSGFSDAPIWLTSVDGAGAARIRPAESDKPTIRGYGIANIVVQGFEVSGPSRLTDPTAAIHFTQNSDKLITNLVIIGNIVRNSIDDGIKIAQAERVLIADNTIDGAANGEGIDLVAVNQARVLNNLVTHVAAKGTAAIQVKGGSTDVVVDGNTISHCGKFGVTIGGVTGPEFMWPGTVDRYEASHIQSLTTISTISRRPRCWSRVGWTR